MNFGGRGGLRGQSPGNWASADAVGRQFRRYAQNDADARTWRLAEIARHARRERQGAQREGRYGDTEEALSRQAPSIN